MPKLYEYFGITVLFYSNEHEPVHVHGKCQGRESKAEIFVLGGDVVRIDFMSVSGRQPLKAMEQALFAELVQARSSDIVQKWIDFFVMNKPVKAERIERRLK